MDRYQVLAYNQGALCVERVEVEADSVDAAFTPVAIRHLAWNLIACVAPDAEITICKSGNGDAGFWVQYAEWHEEMLVMRAYLAEHGYTVEKTDAGYRCVNALGFSDKPEPTEAAAIYWCVKCNGLNGADEDDELDVQWPDPLLSNEGAKQ